MTGVSLKLTGAEDALGVLGDAIARTDRPRKLFDLVGAYLVTSTQKRFEEGRSPEGQVWPQSVRALLTGGKTLIDSGRLLQSLTHNATDQGVEVGTNVIYAAVHQLGATIKPVTAKTLSFVIGDRRVFAKQVTIPARPFLGISNEDEPEIIKIAGNWLLGDEAGKNAG